MKDAVAVTTTLKDELTREEFAELLRPHLQRMARLAARLAPKSDPDDIVQDAALRAWEKRHLYDSARGAYSAWLFAITADQARKANGRRRSHAHLVDLATPVYDADQHLDIEHAVARLSGRRRLAIDCYYFVGLSVSETAAVMRCAEGTVKSTLADARERLRISLER